MWNKCCCYLDVSQYALDRIWRICHESRTFRSEHFPRTFLPDVSTRTFLADFFLSIHVCMPYACVSDYMKWCVYVNIHNCIYFFFSNIIIDRLNPSIMHLFHRRKNYFHQHNKIRLWQCLEINSSRYFIHFKRTRIRWWCAIVHIVLSQFISRRTKSNKQYLQQSISQDSLIEILLCLNS